jgi:hypothetical protein
LSRQIVEEPDEKDLLQDYIDKAYEGLKETGKSINRVIILSISLSLIIITVSTGIVSLGQNFSIFGLNFGIPGWIILLAGSWIIGALYIYLISLLKRNTILENSIQKYYQTVNNSINSKVSLIKSLDIFTIVIFTIKDYSLHGILFFFNFALVGIVAISIFLIPIAAQIFAAYKMLVIFSGAWWLLISFPFLILICFIDMIDFIIFALNN